MTDDEEKKSPEDELPRMSFLEHLEDLRKRLFVSALAIAAGFLVCWWKAKEIFQWLEKPVLAALPPGTKLAYTQLTEPFMLYINIALLAGVFVASPVILYQVWLFIAPGLYRHERKWVWPFVVLSVLFFVGGGYFGYAVGFPMVAKFLVATGEDFMPVLKIDDYLDITSKLLLGMGLVALSTVVMLDVTAEADPLTREDLAFALSVVLLGLLLMVTRRNAVSQVVGFMSLENGLVLAATGAKGMPFVVEISVAFSILIAFIVIGIFLFRIRERFDTVDVQALDRFRGELR